MTYTKEAIKELAQGAAIEAAKDAIASAISDHGVAALPEEFRQHDLEQFMPNRRRCRGAMKTSSKDDFGRYVQEHYEEGATVFVDADRMLATAVLNLGNPSEPGHADNTATLTAKPTAAYRALTGAANGQAMKQSAVAEFFEDWADHLEFANDGGPIEPHKAIGAMRRLTIEAMRKLESVEQQLSVNRTVFESAQATSVEPIPTAIRFTCEPYSDLPPRTFAIRLAILTTGDKPQITLRIAKQEQHAEEMAEELACVVREVLQSQWPVIVGTYQALR